MKWLVFTSCILLCACNSDSSDTLVFEGIDTGSTSKLIPVNGAIIPERADLALLWDRPIGNNDQSWDSYITLGGEVARESALIDPPNPIPPQVVSEFAGVAVAIIVAYPSGLTPEVREYHGDEEGTIDNALGFANTHAVIYKSHEFVRPDNLSPDFEFWGDLFPLGYSCALSVFGGDDGFDYFEPADCSEVELRFGVLSEIELIGFDYT